MLFYISTYSQIYYGKNNFGKFELINDSICSVSFMFDYENKTDTCYYYTNNDTIFISSKRINPIEVSVYSEKQEYNQHYPVLLKSYIKHKDSYELLHEYSYGTYDTINKIIHFNQYKPIKNSIIVIKDGPIYYRFIWEYDSVSHFSINDHNRYQQYTFFNNFPLLVKKNKLIPINKEKNFNCWIENGFYFPIMKKSKISKKYKTVAYWSAGLRGLPSGFNIK